METATTSLKCKTCLEEKACFCFFRNAKNRTGYDYQCKICSEKQKRERRITTQEIARNSIKEKECFACKLCLPIASYYKNSHKSDGYNHVCRDCTSKKKRKPQKQLLPPGKKECSKCLRILDISSFFFDKSKKDGLHTRCKNCHSQIVKVAKRNRVNTTEESLLTALTRKCLGCKQDLTLIHFSVNKAEKFGRNQYCKTCHGIRQRQVQSKHTENFDILAIDFCKPKKCSRCKKIKLSKEFGIRRSILGGLASQCLACCRELSRNNKDTNRGLDAYHSRTRQARKRKALPKWANLENIKQIYLFAQATTEETGIKHVVDHVVPLSSKLVCGLHVEQNLAVVRESENLRKSNYFKPFSVNSSGKESVIRLSQDEKETMRAMIKAFKKEDSLSKTCERWKS